MAEPGNTPWIQTNLGASIVGGGVVLVLGALSNALFEGMPNWVRWVSVAVALVAGLILFSAVNERWRHRVWVPVLRGVGGLRPVTVARLRREVAAERASAEKKRADELAARMKSPSPPSWLMRHDTRMGRDEFDNDTFWLTNMGFPVTEVEVTGDPAFIQLPNRVIFAAHDPGVGHWFAGNITERGRADGVTLTITHINRHGDAGSFDYRLEPEDIAGMGLETRDDAYKRGKADGETEGRTAGVKEGRLERQAEIDAAVAVAVQPVWGVLRERDDQNVLRYRLRNFAKGSQAFNVRIDAQNPEEFSFRSDARWDHIHGDENEAFNGVESRGSKGVRFKVEWVDEFGRPDEKPVFLDQKPPAAPVILY